MHYRSALLALIPVALVSAAPAAPPEKALKYHEALLKRPHNAALFDRFFGAWLDEQPVETLETFLIARAEANGGQEWTVLALHQLRRGQEEPALASLAKAIAAVPGDPALALERAKLRLRRMEFPAARADLAFVLAGKDEALALEAGKLLGKSWLREGKPDEAIRAWDALLAAHPGDEDLLEDLVESAAAEGETAQALVYVDRLIAATKDPYQKTLRSLRRGDLLVRAGRSDEAVTSYEAILAQVGEGSWLESEVLGQIDKLFRKQDRITDLVVEMKRLADANPLRLLIHRQLAKLEVAVGDTDLAIGRFRAILKRSPGDHELREEFIRLLTDGERFEDASAELVKLIALTPADSGLYLQLAALRSRQNQPDAILAALRKAHELMGADEGAGIRIASLMLQYNQAAAGEDLLKRLAAAPAASPAAVEALAAYYGRSNRKDEAIELLKKVAATGEAEAVVRAAGSISALGESATAFQTLAAAAVKFPTDPHVLAALVQSALAADKPAEAVTQAVKLVRSVKQTSEIADSVSLASRIITAADKINEWRTTLEKQATRAAGETCLLASLIEMQGDTAAVAKLLTPATDSSVIHFQAALLDRRGDFDEAIAVLSRLANTEEGRKAGYFKDLAELQQRAGKTTEAIATVERWKLSVPGDKAAWITASRLLQDSGKPEEAVKMTRQAVARFEGDTDLAASLANLHDEAGQSADAEAIYWRLYDEAQAPGDQARWAAQLAKLAVSAGRTGELEEKLRERARGNQRSLGPILAQAELARLTENEDRLRDLLLEAVRLQPKDLDLRLQMANLEERAGNPERVVEVLEEALPFDHNNRVRSALAQAYLRLGQTVKGLRELRATAGKTVGDPRATEQSAGTLAASKLYDEAIQYLREELPDGGDWRTEYLLAMLLEEDGRENEALPWFMRLLDAQGDLPGVTAAQNPLQVQLDSYPESVRKLVEMGWAQKAAYTHKKGEYAQNSLTSAPGNMAGPFLLPVSREEVRNFAAFHLLKLGKKNPAAILDPAIAARIRAAAFPRPELITDLEAIFDDQATLPGLLEKHPDEPGLFELVTMLENADIPLPTVKRILEHPDKLSPHARVDAWMRVVTEAGAGDAAWDSLLAASREALETRNDDLRTRAGWELLAMLGGETAGDEKDQAKGEFPSNRREEIGKIVFDALVTRGTNRPDDQPLRLSALLIIGTPAQWVEGVNQAVRGFRKNPAAARTGQAGANRYPSSQNPGTFELPDLKGVNLRSIPESVLEHLGGSRVGTIDFAEILKRSAGFESPVLRLWVAMKAEDDAAIAKALGVEPPKEEAADFGVLRAIRALHDNRPTAAFAALNEVRALGTSDKLFADWINVSLLAVAARLTPDERATAAPQLEAMLLQCRQRIGPRGAPAVAEQATKLGLTELAKRLAPPPPSGRSGRGGTGFAASGSSRSSGSSPQERIAGFVAGKKYEAAARAALQLLRASGNPISSSDDFAEIEVALGEAGREELIKLVDPGDSKSLVKRLEYADICGRFGKKNLQLANLETLLRERPDDPAVGGRLAFALPADRGDERNRLLTAGALSDDFITQAHESADSLAAGGDDKLQADFFDGIASWLEGVNPDALAKANLSWIDYYSKSYFTNSASGDLPDLLEASSGQRDLPPARTAQAERREQIAKRLALGMLHQPALAEQGFRLLSAAKCWTIPPAELDEHARVALAAGLRAEIGNENSRGSDFGLFELGHLQSSSSSDGQLDSSSSVIRLLQRLDEVKSPDEILPPTYLEELRKIDPRGGERVSALASLKTVEQLGKLWDSGISAGTGTTTEMLRQAVLQRAGSILGAAPFFLERMAKLKSGPGQNQFSDSRTSDSTLVGAALKAAATTTHEEDREALCKAIGRVIYGGKIDWEKLAGAEQMAPYQALRTMEELLGDQALDPVEIGRLTLTFYRLKLPVARESQPFIPALRRHPFSDVGHLEACFEAIGCFAGPETWSPLAAWIVDAGRPGGNGITFTLKEESLVASYFESASFSKAEFIKRLKERKQGRFGALLTASFLSENPRERADLVVQAFTESADALANLPPGRMEEFDSLFASLPPGTAAKLPPILQGRLNGLDDRLRKEILRSADDYLAAKSPRGSGGSSDFGVSDDLVPQLLTFDGGKAADVFLEANRRFTAAIAQGQSAGRLSYEGLAINQRDQALFELFAADGSPLANDGGLALRFIGRLADSPEGGQFSYSPRYQNEGAGVMSRIGKAVRKSAAADKSRPQMDETRRGFEFAMTLPPEIRGDALISIVCSRFDEIGTVGPDFAPAERRRCGEWRTTMGDDFRYMDIFLGAVGWQGDTDEGHQITSDGLAAVFTDPTIHDCAKQALAFRAIARAAGILDHPQAGDALAAMYENYCAADRSAVNGWAPTVIGAAGKVATPAGIAAARRIHQAFWKNTSASKVGGHVTIPRSMSPPLMILAGQARRQDRAEADPRTGGLHRQSPDPLQPRRQWAV